MRDARLKGRAPWAHVNCWEDHLFHSHQRSKIVLHYQSPKPNTYPPVVVVHKFFRWRPPWMTLESSSRKCHYYVTMSEIKLTNNQVQHAKTKHIDVRHHFIRDHQQKGDICIESVGTEDQLTDIFTKAIRWEKVLQAKKWVEHIGFLKYVLMHPPLIWHASLSSNPK